MDNVIKHISIDLYSPTSYEVIYAQQGDNSSRVIEFILYDKGEPYAIPQNTLIRMEGHRGDQSSFIKENCTLSDNVIRATLDDDILYAHGIVEAKIILTQRAEKESSESNGNSHDVILSTIPFRIHVQKNPCDKTKVEAEKRSLIDYLIQKLRELKDTLTTHISDKTNPHNVTKAQVGLGNADNTADRDKYVASANQLTTPRTIDGVSFNGTKSIAHYCICPSLGNAAAKTASLPGFQLVNGAKAAVLFQYGNTAASPTLTVNNTGAKPIHYNGEAISLANAPILKGCCEFVYDGLGHWLLTGRHTFVKGASETAYRDGLVSLTPADIGASPSGHTHSYAGSASSGGPATSANKLNTDAGSQKQPVYFKNGVPIACEDISNYQEVTQAEYERLTASEKEDVVFYITDADDTTLNDLINALDRECIKSISCRDSFFADVDATTTEEISGAYYILSYQKGDGATGTLCTIETRDTTYSNASNMKHGLMSAEDKSKLNFIEPGAQKNVQPNWGETDASSGAYIKNKPTIPTVGNGTVTINQAGTKKGSFSMNQSGDITIDLTDSNTTYGIVSKTSNGLAPQLPNESTTTKYLRQDGIWAVPPNTNTTYPFYSKSIDASFQTKFRTETKGTASSGSYLSNVRTEVANVSNAPQYGAGLAWGSADTHSYLNVNYASGAVYVGGGNADKLNWIKQLAFMDSNVASATNAVNATNSTNATNVNGSYTGSGGAQPPSYIPNGKVRFNMMNSFKGLTALSTYADCILMDTYTGRDVPYVTGFGILKTANNPRAFIAVGAKNNTTAWAAQAELITTGNIGSQSVTSATKLTTSAGNASTPVYFSGGKPVACTGMAKFRTLTQAQYNALSSAEKNNSTIYFITDAN